LLGAVLGSCAVTDIAQAQGAPDAIWTTSNYFGPIAFSPDGSILAIGPYPKIVFVAPSNGHVIRTLDLEEGEWDVASLAFSPNGQLLAAGPDQGGDYRIRIRSVETGQVLQRLEGSSNVVKSLAFNADATLLAAHARGWLRVWRLADGSLLRVQDTDASPPAVSFSWDGTLLAAGSGMGVNIWRVADWQLLHELPAAYLGVLTAAFSPDGVYVATGSFGYEGWYPSFGVIPVRLLLWRVSDGALQTTFPNVPLTNNGMASSINSLAFSPDGKTLVTGSADRTIRFWRVPDGRLLRLYDQSAPGETTGAVQRVAFSPDGRHYAYSRGGTLVMANAPLFVNQAIFTNGQAILQWQGGRGLYQVQQRTNLKTGFWQCAGLASTNLSLTNPLPPGAAAVFYRVVSGDP